MIKRDSLILEIERRYNNPMLLVNIAKVFGIRQIMLDGIHIKTPDEGNYIQYVITFEQQRISSEIADSLRYFNSWRNPIVKVKLNIVPV